MVRKSGTLPWLAGMVATNGSLSTDPDLTTLGQRWWSHVQLLADDRMEGRETGSPGYTRAAEYVSQQFRALGLQPAGVSGYLQPMSFRVTRLDLSGSSLELIRGTEPHSVPLGKDACPVVSSATVERLEADAVFVGYGLSVPELHYDDLAGLDLRGKIVVLVRGGPSDMAGSLKAHFQSPEERSKALRAAGVVGAIYIVDPTTPDLPWPRLVNGLQMARMELSDPGPDGYHPLPMSIAFPPEAANQLFVGSGHSWKELLDSVTRGGPLPRFPLAVRVRSRTRFARTSAQCHNVVGLLPGSDSSVKNEHVVVSAHLDHLGIGAPINGDSVYHGAIDNASGVASILEIARAFHDSGAHPRRSILFLAVTGEEKFLLGSEFFAAHPTVSGPLIANINIDGLWSLFPLRALEVMGVEESTLGDDIRAVAAEAGVRVDSAYEPNRVLFIRSDQYNFIKRGVPALFPGIGYDRGSAEEEMVHKWIADRYHSPADDGKQPVDFVAATRFNALMGQLVLRVANAKERPSWKPESFFKRFAR